ncbi:RICIN domain-containing protein [Actinosynnema sp. NPDC047251]|uniref:RICIN domain-containing protein n=1 Tax=Saccharothrix espanaensis TaxID=103731 RepID=UPI0002E8F417|nr:RICIN domain-containing protein [Saccharothrix espanaensis]
MRPASVEADRRDELLGKGWQKSGDLLWTTSGDAEGFHVLVAEARAGYAWRTAATLRQAGLAADQWIGNACLTGSGKRVAVVYAPRTFVNDAKLFDRGGYTAVVDLGTGQVADVPVKTTLAHYNPGCGTGEVVALTQAADTDLGRTGVFTLDTATGGLSGRTELNGQFTSAVPTAKGVVVAGANALALVEPTGKLQALNRTRGVAYHLTPDADGGVVYADNTKDDDVEVRYVAEIGEDSTPLAGGHAGKVGISRGSAGRVFLTGAPDRVQALPRTVRALDVDADAQVSTTGDAAVTDARSSGKTAVLSAQPVHIAAKSTKTGRDLGFTVDPANDPVRPTELGREDLAAQAPPAGSGSVGVTADDPDSVCSVPRNDPAIQVYQPKPKQVEWAADLAVFGKLDIARPANWHSNGLTGYRPQVSFPPRVLQGGGRVPAQVLLGVLGQESNLWQASKHTMPGDYGNPLIGNYYGLESYDDDPANDWIIRPTESDCGYGVSQMTDGMRRGGSLPPAQQKAIATDYTAAIAAGLQLLQEKWNQLQTAGVRINDNDPAKIENWFAAVWSYNSGYHFPGEAGSHGAYGLGWTNNPANPRYPGDRQAFGTSPRDFATPQRWPYPERVMGFAANPPSGYEAPGVEVPFFRAAWWNTDAQRAAVKPDKYTFCVQAKNFCAPGQLYTPDDPSVVGEPAGPCGHTSEAGYFDLKCWWHDSVTWKADCATSCGNEFVRYDWEDYQYSEPADGTSYPPVCGAAGLPADALVVDDLPRETPPVRDVNCKRSNFSNGAFELSYGTNAQGQQSGKIALQQSGGGYGSHFWFTDVGADNAVGRALRVSARWTLHTVLTTPAEVWVSRPKALESSKSPVNYVVDTANGPLTVTATWPGTDDKWVNLGAFPFNGRPSVSVSSVNLANDNGNKIAFDAVAFVPQTGMTFNQVVKMASNHSGQCLAIQGGSTAAGAPAVQRPCDGGFAENWGLSLISTYVANDAGGNPHKYYNYRIVNRNSGRCLVVPDNRTDVGAPVQQADCALNAWNQSWVSYNEVANQPGASPKNHFFNRNSNLYLGIADCNLTAGAPVQQIQSGTVCSTDGNANTLRLSFINN